MIPEVERMEVVNKLFENGNVPSISDILRSITPKARKRHTTYQNPSARRIREMMLIANGATSDIASEAETRIRDISLARKMGLRDAASYLETAGTKE